MKEQKHGEIVIYKRKNGGADIQVTLKDESLWLNQHQLAGLFDTDRTSILKHIKNIFTSGELSMRATCANFAQVQKEGGRTVTRQVPYYNLDLILSVGYRVNSKRGTQFRIWANRVLKDHLIKGYTLNERRLRQKTEEIGLLKSGIRLLERTVKAQAHDLTEARALISFLADFSGGLGILDDYDQDALDKGGKTKAKAVRITVEECLSVVDKMKRNFQSDVFGRMKDKSFDSSINQIYQSIGGRELYPTIEEKAAMLLYLIVKNHSFIDGNKRIAAALFLYFLGRNDKLYGKSGNPLIGNDGLAAMTLLIAESRPEEMETIRRVVVSILNRGLK